MFDICQYMCDIGNELHVAKIYAHRYAFYKGEKMQWANRYKTMALQEIDHAENLKAMGNETVEQSASVSEDSKRKWEEYKMKIAECSSDVQIILNQ